MRLLCPNCKQGNVCVIVPIVYEWDTAEDGTIIETGRVASLIDMALEEVAICRHCNQRLDIDHENNKVLPAYQGDHIV